MTRSDACHQPNQVIGFVYRLAMVQLWRERIQVAPALGRNEALPIAMASPRISNDRGVPWGC